MTCGVGAVAAGGVEPHAVSRTARTESTTNKRKGSPLSIEKLLFATKIRTS
jgi:hypothetical protein